MPLKLFALLSLLAISPALADDAPDAPVAKPVVIKIDVHADHSTVVTLNGVEYPLTTVPEARANLEISLKDLYKTTPTSPVVIRADKNVEYAQMKDLVDLCSTSGFPSVNVAVPPDSKIELPPAMIQAAQQDHASRSWASITMIVLLSAALLLFIALGLTLFFVLRRDKKARHEKELRRIASLDR